MRDDKLIKNPQGLVLVGGKSSRMHQPKAHLIFDEKPQWAICEEVLRPFCNNVFFSTSPQLTKPLAVEKNRLIEDIFLVPIGPIGGIMSAFNQDRTQAYFVLACDLLFFDRHAVEFLIARRNMQKKATVFLNKDNIEPLCGIYEPDIFTDLAAAWSKKIFCPRAILEKLDIELVSKPLHERWLENFNHVEEYESLNKMSSNKMVTVRYYAAFGEGAKRSTEEVATSAHTMGELFLQLKQKYDFKLGIDQVRFALNDSLVSREVPINDHDAIVFIPPVSGG